MIRNCIKRGENKNNLAKGKKTNKSISKHNLIYKRMVCDGDSKSYNEVRNTYGDNNLVEKVDCTGHVRKRMFRALENIKKSHKGRLSDGKFIGGGGGRLTSGPNGVITRMSQLYRNAIRQNTKKVTISEESVKSGVTKMQNAILAVLYHSIKLSDDAVRHQYCPESTPDTPSWFEFKRDGNMDNKHHHLDPLFLDLLKPQFERLSTPELLKRCLGGYTQNQNESFNSLIWLRCPKHLWKGPFRIGIATDLAVLQWNSGCVTGRKQEFDELNLEYGKYTHEALAIKEHQN